MWEGKVGLRTRLAVTFLTLAAGGAGLFCSCRTPSTAEGIHRAKTMARELVQTREGYAAPFWSSEQDDVMECLESTSSCLERVGRDLRWLHGAIDACDGGWKQGTFETGLWYDHEGQREQVILPYTMVKRGASYTYCISDGRGRTWTGRIQEMDRPDGITVASFELTEARFPGEMVLHSAIDPVRWEPQGTDRLDLYVVPTDLFSEEASGAIQVFDLGQAKPRMASRVRKVTWQYQPTGTVGSAPYVFLPAHAELSVTVGGHTFDGSGDCSGYEGNATATLQVPGSPVWGWRGLNELGTTFTRFSLAGRISDARNHFTNLDFSMGLQNYPALRLDQPLGEGNAPVLQSAFSAMTETSGHPVQTVAVTLRRSGASRLESTLDYQYGASRITGHGIRYGNAAGHGTGALFVAELADSGGVAYCLTKHRSGRYEGTVTFKGTPIGTIRNGASGPFVRFIDGSLEKLS